VLQSSHCKPPLCGSSGCHSDDAGPVYFPPLPYSQRAFSALSTNANAGASAFAPAH
jgi:hypothetical protein